MQYVDNIVSMGNIQPDWFSVYAVGYTNRSIPEFHPLFVEQFIHRAKELETEKSFIVESSPYEIGLERAI